MKKFQHHQEHMMFNWSEDEDNEEEEEEESYDEEEESDDGFPPDCDGGATRARTTGIGAGTVPAYARRLLASFPHCGCLG